jgi:deoxyribodipyrimidine photo-lyase
VDVAVVLFTRDLRVHDNPALAACRAARRVVPMFVVHSALRVPPIRRAFLAGALADLRDGLRRRGGDLVIRTGDPVVEAVRLAGEVGAQWIAVARDVTPYAQRRHARLEAACQQERLALRGFDSLTVVPPLAIAPRGGDHYRVFTPATAG